MAAREGQRQPLLHLVSIQAAGIEQDPDESSGEQAGQVVTVSCAPQGIAPQLLGCLPQQPDGRVGFVYQTPASLGFLGSEPAQRHRQAGAGPAKQRFNHFSQPAGVSARALRECLLLQLKKKRPTPDTALALRILNEHFDAFTRKHYEKIRRALDLDEATLKAVLREITRLNPKPGNGWNEASDTAMNRITPDFIVDCHNGQLSLSMNQRDAPELHVNREYADMFRDYLGNKSNRSPEMRNAVQFVKQKLDAARWFIDAVRQRRETLQRTMEAILMLQTDFFLTGDETKLRPMILKDVAEHAGYDISTVSRVSNSKYVQTNFGIYPLKFFFSEGVLNDQGEEISTREIKKIMRETIDAEDKRNPVTDEALCALLRAKGYTPARRTVAKYREQLGIPVARLRKEL